MDIDETINLEINNLEEKVLYILLKYPEKQDFILSNCQKEFFQDVLNAQIFEKIKTLIEKGIEADATAICAGLDKSEFNSISLKLFDIISYGFAASVQAKTYCKLLLNKHLKKCYKNIKTDDDFKWINELKEKYEFNDDAESDFHISAKIDELEGNYSKDSSKAIFTLFNNLDECLGSLNGGDYIVCGASTSVGKSTFALNIARNVCVQDKTVMYFSLEMPLVQIQNKLICMDEGLNANKYRNFGFNLGEWDRFKKGAENLKQWNLHIITNYGLTPEKMRSYIQKQKKVDFIVLDYLGLMSGYSNKSLYEKTTHLSRQIKLLATEFDVPILCLVQLNRDLKNRPDKRPCLFDIRESGAIEQDADIVLLLHREGIYNENVSPNKLEVLIAKNRHGESNRSINLNFDLRTQLIKEF